MTDRRRVLSIVGVYDADGTTIGEVRYWFGARLGRVHCELCDITHGTFRRKREWDSFVASCGVPFETFHRDDAPVEVMEVAGDLAAVVAITTDGPVLLLGPDRLEGCRGDVAAFARSLDAALVERGFPPVSGTAGASPR